MDGLRAFAPSLLTGALRLGIHFVEPSKMQPDGMNFDDAASSPADLDMQCEAQPARLCLQQSLPIPGCLHIVHNATRHMLSAMPHFEDKVRPGFSALVDFLHKKITRAKICCDLFGALA